jgi:hypothetical protein
MPASTAARNSHWRGPELKVEELRVLAGFEQPGSRKSHRGLAFVA